ncbi:hypothetical protein PMAYCL1PPCAC_20847, partial [Pristionchus mayeri]
SGVSCLRSMSDSSPPNRRSEQVVPVSELLKWTQRVAELEELIQTGSSSEVVELREKVINLSNLLEKKRTGIVNLE